MVTNCSIQIGQGPEGIISKEEQETTSGAALKHQPSSNAKLIQELSRLGILFNPQAAKKSTEARIQELKIDESVDKISEPGNIVLLMFKIDCVHCKDEFGDSTN